MGMPSDVTSDVADAVARLPTPAQHSDGSITLRLSPEQVGLGATALIVFLGVSVIGPRIAALLRPKRPTLKAKAQRAAEDARLRSELAGHRVRRRVRQLGGGTIRL